ncbi:hypothetical protein U1Q18_011326 [Sarracenia purpurea var. burkii]
MCLTYLCKDHVRLWLAHSACDFDGGKAEKLALAKYRQVNWQGRVLNSQFTDEGLGNQGRCSLTPEAIGLLLAALGFDSSTRLYLASHKCPSIPHASEIRYRYLIVPILHRNNSRASYLVGKGSVDQVFVTCSMPRRRRRSGPTQVRSVALPAEVSESPQQSPELISPLMPSVGFWKSFDNGSIFSFLDDVLVLAAAGVVVLCDGEIVKNLVHRQESGRRFSSIAEG